MNEKQNLENLENKFTEFQKHFLEYEIRDEEKHKQNEREHQEMLKTFKPVGDWFKEMTYGKKYQLTRLKIAGMIIGVFLGLMALFTGFYQFIKFIFFK